MKKCLILGFLFYFVSNSFAQTFVSGNISGNWGISKNPYIVTGNIKILDSLVIEPGVIVKFQAGQLKIEVGESAKLKAIGTENEKIIFEPFNGVSPGSFLGIELIQSGNDDILEYCVIRYATNGIYSYECSPKINECYIYGNSEHGVSVIVHSDHYSSTIKNCTIFDNHHSGIYVKGYDRYGTASDTVIIDHCTLFNNAQNGILIFSGTYWNWGNAYSLAKISNCTVFNNGTGVRAYAYRGYADAFILNSIIAYNETFGVANQDSRSYISASDLIYNCFWGNKGGNFTPDIKNEGFGQNGAYKNSNNDSCDVYFNIYNNPLFIDTTSFNFNLHANSKCVNAGTPIINNQYVLDPDSTLPDMGSYYYPLSTSISYLEEIETELYQNYPNPFHNYTLIPYKVQSAENVKLEIYNIKGELIKTIFNEYQGNGIQTVIWDGKNNKNQTVNSGIYFYKLITNNKVLTKRMLLLR